MCSKDKWTQGKKWKLVSAGLFAEVFLFRKEKKYYFAKRFLYPDNYFLNGYNLSVIFKRNRLDVCIFFESFFTKNINNSYLCKTVYVSKINNIAIVEGGSSKGKNVDELIGRKHFGHCLKELKILSKELLKCDKKKKGFSKFDNKNILNFKIKMQLRKPLQFIMNKDAVEKVVSKIGAMKYVNHGDLQPKNIIYINKKLKIIDFEEGFIGPFGWDIGFLWGNLIYLTIADEKDFLKTVEIFEKNIISSCGKQAKYNILLFCLCSILMRINMFPLRKFSHRQIEKLNVLVSRYIKLLEN
jgi:thiamine kinase-like enzyme